MKMRPDQQAYLALVKKDFGTFAKQAFATLYPNKVFEPNWHIEAITHALEESYAGAFPAADHQPATAPPEVVSDFSGLARLLADLGPVAEDLLRQLLGRAGAHDRAGLQTRVMESDWYRVLFPQVRLVKVTENDVVTDQGGYRAALSVHGSITGPGR